ncbi:probable glutamine synthetase [Fusarium mangiferae]|uniref:Glutamine synthetase n=1 Tax=Fusarium mangiferae TaxID=192010 RepID=A0A1L7U3N4_FUSMA|nr:putative glutamine synthetase [Fusarium mangiferae]CVL02565.1 probable glutamine synthetase [Fusarium mangiferae]
MTNYGDSAHNTVASNMANGKVMESPIDEITKLLARDKKVKVAGIDCDGILRGKIIHKSKFLSSLESGFGMSSAIFGWDMHDVLYTQETSLTSADSGYQDFTAVIDLNSFRRLPFEDNIAFFLLRFYIHEKPVFADGRGMVKALTDNLVDSGYRALAGVELEFMNFQTPSQDGYGSSTDHPNLAAFLAHNAPKALRPVTAGAFGYSATRPIMAKQYFHDIFDQSLEVDCPVEGWHTESGPCVYEAALAVSQVSKMADNVALFKLVCKSVGVQHNITPCFMAKPIHGLPGNSGHIHVSLTTSDGKNAFVQETPDIDARWPDMAYLSDTGRYFLAGIISALPDIMPLLAPNVNSYKRLVENYWAPVSVSWGFEDRLASIRLVAPPSCKPSATRFEIRVPGADIHPHYALSAIFYAGLRGIKNKMQITTPPESARPKEIPAERLPNTLEAALERFSAKDSVARQILGDDFVDFFTVSRCHELRQWREAVTDW